MRLYFFLIISLVTINLSAALRPFHSLRLPHDAEEVRSMCQDETGMIWIGSKRGLYSYNGHDFHKMPYHETVECERLLLIGKYICITTSSNLLWFNIETEQFEDVHHSLLSDMPCRGLALVDGTLWVGTLHNGLYCLNLETDEVSEMPLDGLKETLVYDIVDAGSKIYVSSYECLSVYNKQTKKRTVIDSTVDAHYTNIRLDWDDKRQCLWIPTGKGLYKVLDDESMVEEIKLLHNITFKGALCRKNEDYILLLSDNGVFEYYPETKEYVQYMHYANDDESLSNNVVFSAFVDKSDNTYICTGRAISISPANNGITLNKISKKTGNDEGIVIMQIVKGKNDELWMRGDNGLIHSYNKDGEEKYDWYRAEDSQFPLTHNIVRDIYYDRDSILWIATDGNIARYDENTMQFVFYDIVTEDNHRTTWSYGIIEDMNGRLWIGTYAGGLISIDKKRLLNSDNSHPIVTESTPSAMNEALDYIVYQMEQDEHGNIWLLSNNGLAYLDVAKNEIYNTHLKAYNFRYTPGHIWFSDNGQVVDYDIARKDTVNIAYKVQDGQIYNFFTAKDKVFFSSSEGVFFFNANDHVVQQLLLPDFLCVSGLFPQDKHTLIIGSEDSMISIDTDIYYQTWANSSYSLYISNIIYNGENLGPGEIYKENKNIRYCNTIHLSKRCSITLELSDYRFSTDKDNLFQYNLDDSGWMKLSKGENKLLLDNLTFGHHKLQLCRYGQTANQTPITTYDIYVRYPWYLQWWTILLYIALVVFGMVKLIGYIQRRERIIIVKQHLEDPFVLEVNRIIEENMHDEDFNVSGLASKLNITQKQLYRKLKPLTEVTPVNYLRRRRMQTAAILLKEGKYTIQEVMYKVGFSNSSYFSRCFTEEFGISPSKYGKS